MPYDLDQWIKEAPFRFAKTMPENPHWYITERECRTTGFGAELRAFVDHVHAHGGTRFFKGYPYRTITLDEHDYWLTHAGAAGWIVRRAGMTRPAGRQAPKDTDPSGRVPTRTRRWTPHCRYGRALSARHRLARELLGDRKGQLGWVGAIASSRPVRLDWSKFGGNSKSIKSRSA